MYNLFSTISSEPSITVSVQEGIAEWTKGRQERAYQVVQESGAVDAHGPVTWGRSRGMSRQESEWLAVKLEGW